MDGFLQDYTANISRGGTMIYTRREVHEGQALQLVISFPGLLRPIRLNGVVRWTREHSDGESAFGVEFEQDESSGWPLLERLVSQIADGDARVVAADTRRVLLVEDNEHMANLIRRGLETYLWRTGAPLAFDVQHVPNGLDALSRMQAERFDLLLVDVFLPMLGGDELIERVRASPRWRELPIIAFSAEDEEVRARAIEVGADFFLAKPLRLNQLIETMSKLALRGQVEFQLPNEET